MDEKQDRPPDRHIEHSSSLNNTEHTIINASGHTQQLERQFSLLSIISVGAVVGNTWCALGGSILTSIYNGGPPGAIYEFIAVSIFYWIIAACIAELASSIPSSAGVYHWASVTAGPKHGRFVGFVAGWWNFWAWLLGAASTMTIIGNICVQMYALSQGSEFTPQAWHVFVAYILVTWFGTSIIVFGNRFLPLLNTSGLFFILAGVFITIVTCAAMPGTGARSPHAASDFVWSDWSADLGYDSAGFIFLMGMLNGAFAVGTPDCVSHLAEEIPQPERNIPRAIAAQMIIGFITGLAYLIAIFYAISDLNGIYQSGGTFPVAQIYLQATSSSAGATGLLVLILIPIFVNSVGAQLTASRTLWTLARDKATPFPSTIARVSARWNNPVYAQLVTATFVTVLGCIYVGSTTAFSALIGSYVILSTASYVAALLPNLLTRRRYVRPGPFFMKGLWGDTFLGVSCVYIIVFIVIFCFPYSLPVTAQSMNVRTIFDADACRMAD